MPGRSICSVSSSSSVSARAAAPVEASRLLWEALCALARTASGRVRLRAVGAARDREARGASARGPPGADRGGSRPRRNAKLVPELELFVGRAPTPGAPPRPAHARSLSLGKAGGRARGVSRCETLARGDARHRTHARAPAARALDSRPGSRARSRRRRPSDRQWRGSRADLGDVARRPSWGGRVSFAELRGSLASGGRAAPHVDGCSRIGQDAPGARGDERVSMGRGQTRCSSSWAASPRRGSSRGRSQTRSG